MWNFALHHSELLSHLRKTLIWIHVVFYSLKTGQSSYIPLLLHHTTIVSLRVYHELQYQKLFEDQQKLHMNRYPYCDIVF